MKHVVPVVALAAAVPLVMPRSIAGNGVRADASNPTAVLTELRAAVEAMRSENDAALRKVDGVQSEKVERINAAVGELQAALNDMAIKLAAAQVSGASGARPGDDPAYNTAFTAFARTGEGDRDIKAQQFAGPRAAMSVGSNPDGGLLAPIEWDRTITDRLKIVSAMRGLARVVTISGTSYKKVFNDRAAASGWVGETAARPATGNPQLTEATFETGELYAKPLVSQILLEDALVNIEAWLASEVDTEFAYQEGLAFVNGDGSNKRPRGFLQYAAGNLHPFGNVPIVNTGSAAALSADGIIDLVHDLPSERTPNAAFIMNRKTQGAIRKMKNADGDYLWEPSHKVGDPATLQGFPIAELAAMPDVAANSLPIAFGDWGNGYLIIDRLGVQLLRDPYSSKPYVEFYTRKRVGGGVIDPTCLRYHRVAA